MIRSLRNSMVLLLACCLPLTSCQTVREVGVPSAETGLQVPDIEPGDRVVVLLKSGKSKSFKVTSVGTEAVYGKDISVRYEDMQSLEIRNLNTGRSILLGAVVVVGVAVAYYARLVVRAITEEDE